jgi:uncharacterized repeat protein (TIGR03803 family)
MRSKRISIGLRTTLVTFIVISFVTSGYAATEQVLYSFNGGFPFAGLISDSAGNLYGTTRSGGDYGCGSVFELTLTAGSWTGTVLHSFNGGACFPYNTADGEDPYAGLIFDAIGNLYGTTRSGGDYDRGTVFELTPTAGGWTETVLYSSFNHKNGAGPFSGLISDSVGNLYGTTYRGGTYGYGTVFELIKPGTKGRSWIEKILHSFYPKVGIYPYAGLISDSAGNLFGTTLDGGTYGYGTVFELIKPASKGGSWTEKILHSFEDNGTDGGIPYAGLVFDTVGNLYGTTLYGGAHSGSLDLGGIAFELIKPGTKGGSWTETVLYTFNGAPGDGAGPYAGLIIDSAGNLYGTTSSGGVYGSGTAFELTLTMGMSWTETMLHSFDGNGMDGESPEAGVLQDTAGNLYGTTVNGGAYDYGTVFEITP